MTFMHKIRLFRALSTVYLSDIIAIMDNTHHNSPFISQPTPETPGKGADILGGEIYCFFVICLVFILF